MLRQVLYDGLCPICVAEIRFLQLVQRNVKPGGVDFVDISLAGYDGAEHAHVSYEMAMEVMHVIDEHRQVRVPSADFRYSAERFSTGVVTERDRPCANRSTGGSLPSQ